MARIDDAYTRFERAAHARGMQLGHYGSILRGPEPFDEAKWLPEFAKRGIEVPEEYLAILRRWNGIYMRDPTKDFAHGEIGVDIHLYSVDSIIEDFDDLQDHLEEEHEEGNESPIFDGFFEISTKEPVPVLISPKHISLAYQTKGKSEVIYMTDAFGDMLCPAFESFSHMLHCCAQFLEEGYVIPPCPRVEDDWRSKIRFYEICIERNPSCSIWREQLPDLRAIAADYFPDEKF